MFSSHPLTHAPPGTRTIGSVACSSSRCSRCPPCLRHAFPTVSVASLACASVSWSSSRLAKAKPSPASRYHLVARKGPLHGWAAFSHTHTHTHISPQSRERERTLRAESQSLLRSRISLGGLFSVQLMHARIFPAPPHYQSHPSRQPRTHALTQLQLVWPIYARAVQEYIKPAQPPTGARAHAHTFFPFPISSSVHPTAPLSRPFHASRTTDRCDASFLSPRVFDFRHSPPFRPPSPNPRDHQRYNRQSHCVEIHLHCPPPPTTNTPPPQLPRAHRLRGPTAPTPAHRVLNNKSNETKEKEEAEHS